jgi:hypothetical protein
MEYTIANMKIPLRPCSKTDLPLVFKDEPFLRTLFRGVTVDDMKNLEAKLKSAMSNSKKEPRTVSEPSCFLINGTYWSWPTASHPTRDWVAPAQSVVVEQEYIKLYRPALLEQPSVRQLRTALQNILSGMICPVKESFIKSDGKTGYRTVRTYSYPDRMEVITDGDYDERDCVPLLKKLAKYRRRLEAQKAIAKIVKAIESMEYSHDKGNLENGVTAEMHELVTKMIAVRHI